MNEKSKLSESTEKSVSPPRRKLNMATAIKRPKRPRETVAKVEEVVEKPKDKKEQAVDFIKEKLASEKGGASLLTAIRAVFQSDKLLVASLSVVLATLLAAIFFFHQIDSWATVKLLNLYTPPQEGFLFYLNWIFVKLLSIFIFYISLILSYTITSPLYSFISMLAENIYFGKPADEADFSFSGICKDLIQAVKISLASALISFAAFFLNFIPFAGQIAAIIAYIFVNSLLLFDFPTSRRRWFLKQKIRWIFKHPVTMLRVGTLPAFISFLPVISNIIIPFLFPFLVVHATMNFVQRGRATAENSQKNRSER